jgi:hypothetical protein
MNKIAAQHKGSVFHGDAVALAEELRRKSSGCRPLQPYGLAGPFLFVNSAKRSIGTGKNVVVLCSLDISRRVWRKRSWSA